MPAVRIHGRRTTPIAVLASLAIVSASLLAFAPAASAEDDPNSPGQSGEHKITICHRTNSTSNPYVSITVDTDAADGDLSNDRGQGDHYLEHTGPVWNASMPNGADWGDIIPPIPDVHSGLNWDAAGQAIYNNGCNAATFTSTKTAGGTAPYCLNGVDGSYEYSGSGTATSSISQADADAKAQKAADDAAAADKASKLPSGAIAGSCAVFSATRSAGGSVSYCLNGVEGAFDYAGESTQSSTISEADAATKAQAAADSQASAERAAKLPAGAVEGTCTPKTPETPLTPSVVEPAVVDTPTVIAVPGKATVTDVPARVPVPSAVTLPASVPAGGGSSVPALPVWALVLLVAGALGAVVTGARVMRDSA